jgi:hypothetical protein
MMPLSSTVSELAELPAPSSDGRATLGRAGGASIPRLLSTVHFGGDIMEHEASLCDSNVDGCFAVVAPGAVGPHTRGQRGRRMACCGNTPAPRLYRELPNASNVQSAPNNQFNLFTDASS